MIVNGNENVEENGWEEICDLSLDYLLKTSLVDGSTKQISEFVGTNGQTLKIPADLSKLKKRITTVIDRLASGVRFFPDEDDDEESDEEIEDDEDDEDLN